ncbi:MAG TPA: phytochelatin synthase family protein [Trichocoleus sp.]|jgi:hypothetical protein
MKQKTITLAIQSTILGLCLAAGSAIAQTLTLPNSLIAFNSEQGEALFLSSRAREDFWNLSSQFVTQVNQAYCGVASMVMVLNSLGIPAPVAPQYEPYHVFTQENFFDNPAARQVIRPDVVARQGLTLAELEQLLESYQVQATVHHAGDTSIDDFRRLATENLNQPGNFIIINYLRRELGQESGGHISPVAAYDEATDRFLILDVARYKYPPVWVKSEDLWRSMNTLDSTSNKTRGFILINR